MPAASTLSDLSMPESRSSAAARRLVVAWQHPGTRAIEPVGFLSYDDHLYRFAYIQNALSVDGFRPLLGFDDLRRAYSSERLFPLFAQRAMDARRADYGRYVASLGLEGKWPEPWEQIARSQGRRERATRFSSCQSLKSSARLCPTCSSSTVRATCMTKPSTRTAANCA